MLSTVIGSSVGYGVLLGFLALSGCPSLVAYWLNRRHPVLSKRMPWLALLSSAFGLLLSLVLVLHVFLPNLPSLSYNALPCTFYYVASHLYCGLILLPYILRTVRLLSLYSPTSTDDSRRGKQLAPSFYPLTLVFTLALLSVAGVLIYFFGGGSAQSDVDNSASQCLLFDYWQYFIPLCGGFFLVWSWLLLKVSESRREDPYSLCFEHSACWLSVAILLVSYFVLLTLPSSTDLESSFPIEWIVVGLNFCLQVFSVWMPLYYVWQFNRHQRNNAVNDASHEEERAPTVAPSASSAPKRGHGKSIELVKAGDDRLAAPAMDEADELNKSVSLDGLPAPSNAVLAKMAGAVSGGAMDVTNVWSIDRILSDPTANVLLEQHAQRFLCSELVLCWNDIQKHNGTPWRMDSATDLDAAYASGFSIYNTYIKAGSLYEVNVDSKIRSALAAVFDKPHSQQERRALMVRDLHAKRKLMREMDRRSAAAADRRQQRHNRTQDSMRAHNSQLAITSHNDRPHTPTLSQSQRQQQLQLRPMLGQTPNSTIVMLVDEGDEQRPEQEAGDIVRTLQPANTGELTTLQAITTNALNPHRARDQRAATVNYGSNAALALQPPVVADLASSNVFSQTLQMPLSFDSTAHMYDTAATSGGRQVSAAESSEQPGMSASATTLQHSSAVVSVSSGRAGRSHSLGVAFFTRKHAALTAVEGSSTGPLSARHRRASSEQSQRSSRQQLSATTSASRLHVTNDSSLPTVINYSTPLTAQLPQPERTTSHLDLVHAPDMHRNESSESNNGVPTATQQQQAATISLRPSTPSASSTSFTQSVSASTPFPLSALEMAALSSQLIFHRCAHEVKKLLDTNLYLSFIRQSVEFRKFRLQRRKEEREAALATRRQMMMGTMERRGESQGIITEAVQIMVVSHGASEASAADPAPAE